MNQNIVIALSVGFTLVFAFIILFFIMNYYSELNASWFDTVFLSDKHNDGAFLFGTSYVLRLNNTHIEQALNNNGLLFPVPEISRTEIRNLQYLIDDITSHVPKIVVIGVGYYDLGWLEYPSDMINPIGCNTAYGKFFFDQLNFKMVFNNIIDKISSNFEIFRYVHDVYLQNPKFVSINLLVYLQYFFTTSGMNSELRDQANNIEPVAKIGDSKRVILTQHNNDHVKDAIVDINELNKNDPTIYCMDYNKNEETLQSLNFTISKLKANDIDVILFTPPFTKSYNEKIPQELRNTLIVELTNLAKKYDIEYYDLSRKYETKNIFNDRTHVAKNPQSVIYSERIASMIISNFKS